MLRPPVASDTGPFPVIPRLKERAVNPPLSERKSSRLGSVSSRCPALGSLVPRWRAVVPLD